MSRSEFENSAEFRWLNKEVLDSRAVDDMTDSDTWTFSGTGSHRFIDNATPDGSSALRVDVQMFTDEPAPTSRELSAVNLSRAFRGWTFLRCGSAAGTSSNPAPAARGLSASRRMSGTWKTLNFFFGQRCGFDVPGSHGVDHRDWFATHGDERIVMNGGWHDAGDIE